MSEKKAFVIPAFETLRYRLEFPSDKPSLLKMLDEGTLYTFRYVTSENYGTIKVREPTSSVKQQYSTTKYKYLAIPLIPSPISLQTVLVHCVPYYCTIPEKKGNGHS